jgi:hypothetical protein
MSTPSGTKTGFNKVRIAETLEVDGLVSFESAVTAPVAVAATSGATKTVAVEESGSVFVQTASSGTTAYTLPAAAPGLKYTFVCGNAGGEILINVATGDAIVTKIHAAQDGTALAPAAGTGIKNTAATNVAGDSITLVALNDTTWYGISLIGLWASQ